jgi:KDO2-lipid IV(A) lauroyltransferase
MSGWAMSGLLEVTEIRLSQMNSSQQSKRSTARNLLEYALLRALLGLAALLPWSIATTMCTALLRALAALNPKLRRTGLRNLELAFPERTAAERERLLDGMFHSLGRILATVARMPRLSPATIGRYIRYEGREHFERAIEQGKGVLFFTAHLGNWELSAFAHGMLARPMHIVVRPLDNPLLDGYACRLRGLSGNRIIGKKEYARGILKALAANEAVGILADQNAAPEEGVFVDFFGVPACAHAGFARLAAHSGAVVIPGFALWSEREGRYVLRFDAPVAMTGDAAADTQRLHAHLESVIREYPEQWLWIHRRWKTRPPGAPPLY